MKTLFEFSTTFIICLLLNFACVSQNLVPNFSFEQYNACPDGEDQIQYATGWNKYSATTTTPDYYHACANPGLFGVPQNLGEYRPAHRNCSAIIGLCTYFVSTQNYREQIGIQLSHSLIIGKKYFISFYVVASKQIIGGSYWSMPSNNIGIKLSTVLHNEFNPAPFDNMAQLNCNSIITDTSNWQRISGSFIADSSYDYLMIGNFFDDSHTDTLHYPPYINGDTCWNSYSYYYVDDVCLSSDSLLCNGGIDLLPCTEDITENVNESEINISPNPCIDYLTISLQDSSVSQIALYDMVGRLIYSNIILADNYKIDFTGFSSGYYLLTVVKKNNNKTIKKIFKI